MTENTNKRELQYDKTYIKIADCAKLIIQAGVKRVCYKEKYRDTSGIDFIKENIIVVE